MLAKNQRFFPRCQLSEIGVFNKAQMQSRATAPHRAVEWRRAIEELDLEAEPVAIVVRRALDIAHEKDGNDAGDFGHEGYPPLSQVVSWSWQTCAAHPRIGFAVFDVASSTVMSANLPEQAFTRFTP